MKTLDECNCSCHQTGAVHIVACCTGVSKYGIPAIKPYASGGYVKGVPSGDGVPTMLLKGEFEIDAEVVKRYGPDLLAVINGQVDVHAYRPAIHEDCVIGTCSMNNCLYPSCAKEPKPHGIVDDVVVDVKPTDAKILEEFNAAFEREFGKLVRHDLTPEEIADREKYYAYIGSMG